MRSSSVMPVGHPVALRLINFKVTGCSIGRPSRHDDSEAINIFLLPAKFRQHVQRDSLLASYQYLHRQCSRMRLQS